LTWTESWQSEDLSALEERARVRSFAMDPAWADAASSSGYATPLHLALEERGSLQAAAMGLRRVRMGVSKVVCGSNGGVGILAVDPPAGDISDPFILVGSGVHDSSRFAADPGSDSGAV